MGAQRLEPDAAFEIREGIGDGECRGGEDDGFLSGKGPCLELAAGRGGCALDERPA